MKHFYLFLLIIGGLFTQTTVAQQFSFTPPENFIADTISAGTWRNTSAGSVIQISMASDAPFNEFKTSFDEKQLTDNNLVIKEKRTDDQAMTYICSYRTVSADGSQDVEFTRIVYFTGNTHAVVMAVATIPAMAEPVLLEPLIQSFRKDLIIR
ncbi:hypothetical protein DSECCO2_658520 [anaerobic digester metagenome]